MGNKLANVTQIAALVLLLALGLMVTTVLAILLLQGKVSLDILTTLLGVVLGYIGHALGVQTGATAALSQSPNTTTVSSTQPVAVVPVNVTPQAGPGAQLPPQTPLQTPPQAQQGAPGPQGPVPGAQPVQPWTPGS